MTHPPAPDELVDVGAQDHAIAPFGEHQEDLELARRQPHSPRGRQHLELAGPYLELAETHDRAAARVRK